MPAAINIRKQPIAPPPPSPSEYEQLVARVTKGGASMAAPPAAGPPPRLPLPENVVIAGDGTTAVPPAAQELIAQARAEAEAPPVLKPSALTPEQLAAVDINTVTPEQRAQVEAVLAQATGAQQSPSRPVEPELVFADPAAPTAAAPPPPKSETGADAPAVAFCPHCNGDISQPAGPEPTRAEKLEYLVAFLGGRCYQRTVSLLGGHVTATFRTLTPRQLDTLYIQAYADRGIGRITNDLDYWERINRYRMFLQLVSLRAIGTNGFVHELPDGLDPVANPMATACWECDPAPTGETVLPQIEDYIVKNVVKTESIYRTINSASNQFNRTVARMEVNAANPDFWPPIAPPS